MMKVLNPTTHAVLDYGLAILFLLAPALFGFSGVAASVSYAVGVVYLAVSLLTQYPLGLFKLIPFPVHGVLESISAAAWIVIPWLFGFAEIPAARNFFILAGIGLLIVAALTNYRAAQPAAARQERRHATAERRQRPLAVARDRRMAIADRRHGGWSPA